MAAETGSLLCQGITVLLLDFQLQQNKGSQKGLKGGNSVGSKVNMEHCGYKQCV